MVALDRASLISSMFSMFSLTQASVPTRIEIAPNVLMPQMTMNAHNATSEWIQVAKNNSMTLTGVDWAFDYGEAGARALGDAMRKSGLPRSQFFLTSRVPCCPKDVNRWPFLKFSGCNHSRDTDADYKSSLEWFGVGYVDLVLMHWSCDRYEDTLRTWRAMESFAASGTARAIGVSNYNEADIDQLMKDAIIKPSVNQAGYAIGSPGNATLGRDAGTIKRCRELNITYEAYGVFGEPHATAPTSAVDIMHHPIVLKVAQHHNVSAEQVAARWVVQQGMAFVASSADPVHMQSDLQIFDFQLSESEMAELTAVREPAVVV